MLILYALQYVYTVYNWCIFLKILAWKLISSFGKDWGWRWRWSWCQGGVCIIYRACWSARSRYVIHSESNLCGFCFSEYYIFTNIEGTLNSVYLLSRVQLCNPMNCSTPGLPVHHQLPEFTKTHVHRVSDAIQPSHPLSSPSPPAPNSSQNQTLFQWVNSSYEVAKVLEFLL